MALQNYLQAFRQDQNQISILNQKNVDWQNKYKKSKQGNSICESMFKCEGKCFKIKNMLQKILRIDQQILDIRAIPFECVVIVFIIIRKISLESDNFCFSLLQFLLITIGFLISAQFYSMPRQSDYINCSIQSISSLCFGFDFLKEQPIFKIVKVEWNNQKYYYKYTYFGGIMKLELN
ncbi:unnamed protein product [Paramecium octaurelia]|uniref:Transmembrane protein n=1 Tax=Paramecium octaurelia TaxID=43137 RepID=A0A8S1XZ75_PAROT|nr:unnamed protein product [Paramecium octaurelia]